MYSISSSQQRLLRTFSVPFRHIFLFQTLRILKNVTKRVVIVTRHQSLRQFFALPNGDSVTILTINSKKIQAPFDCRLSQLELHVTSLNYKSVESRSWILFFTELIERSSERVLSQLRFVDFHDLGNLSSRKLNYLILSSLLHHLIERYTFSARMFTVPGKRQFSTLKYLVTGHVTERLITNQSSVKIDCTSKSKRAMVHHVRCVAQFRPFTIVVAFVIQIVLEFGGSGRRFNRLFEDFKLRFADLDQ